MPGFKYHFKPAEIDAIVAYIKTIPRAVRRTAARQSWLVARRRLETMENPMRPQVFIVAILTAVAAILVAGAGLRRRAA